MFGKREPIPRDGGGNGGSGKAGQRGQSALEYLMTYGWALIVLVIVVAALFFLGILNPSTYQGKTCTGFNKTAYAGEHDFNGTRFIVKLQNNAGFNIDLNNVSSTVTISGTTVQAPTLTFDDNTNIPVGGTFTLTAPTRPQSL